MARATDSDWIILRTASRSTLRLAETLAKDGFEVWTPKETKQFSGYKAAREVICPLMASYVFARAVHLIDLLQLAEMPVKPRRGPGLRDAAHAGFSVLHAFGRIPVVADHDFNALRRLEARRTPIKRSAYTFQRNASVKAPDGIFGGLTGMVVRSTPKATVLCFGTRIEFEFPTSLLSMDDLCCGEVALQAA